VEGPLSMAGVLDVSPSWVPWDGESRRMRFKDMVSITCEAMRHLTYAE
jgi:hypothetical protein